MLLLEPFVFCCRCQGLAKLRAGLSRPLWLTGWEHQSAKKATLQRDLTQRPPRQHPRGLVWRAAAQYSRRFTAWLHPPSCQLRPTLVCQSSHGAMRAKHFVTGNHLLDCDSRGSPLSDRLAPWKRGGSDGVAYAVVPSRRHPLSWSCPSPFSLNARSGFFDGR
jgi:hypothetical protein